MATYEINFPALSQATVNLEETIKELQTQMQRLNDIRENMLSDKLWYGPNKSRFSQSFSNYQTELDRLYKNAVDHHSKLVEITTTYKQAEIN